jgi:hypothetical protein
VGKAALRNEAEFFSVPVIILVAGVIGGLIWLYVVGGFVL